MKSKFQRKGCPFCGRGNVGTAAALATVLGHWRYCPAKAPTGWLPLARSISQTLNRAL